MPNGKTMQTLQMQSNFWDKTVFVLIMSATEKVKVSELMEYHHEMDFYTFLKLSDFEIRGYKYVNIPIGTLDGLKRLRLEKKKKDRVLIICVERNNIGMNFENNGVINRAVEVFPDEQKYIERFHKTKILIDKSIK